MVGRRRRATFRDVVGRTVPEVDDDDDEARWALDAVAALVANLPDAQDIYA